MWLLLLEGPKYAPRPKLVVRRCPTYRDLDTGRRLSSKSAARYRIYHNITAYIGTYSIVDYEFCKFIILEDNF